MDSGCSYHMTPRLDILFDFLECDEGSVQLGDNRECKIRGIGKVRIQLRDGSSLVLHNVRYIPELKRNLISLGILEKEGFTVKLQSGKVKVINGSRVVLSGIRMDNCVYSLDCHAMAGELNASVKKKTVLRRDGTGADLGVEDINKEEGLAAVGGGGGERWGLEGNGWLDVNRGWFSMFGGVGGGLEGCEGFGDGVGDGLEECGVGPDGVCAF
ncbi:hypothetical protein Tco_1386831 [Tanacetum coccineum]